MTKQTQQEHIARLAAEAWRRYCVDSPAEFASFLEMLSAEAAAALEPALDDPRVVRAARREMIREMQRMRGQGKIMREIGRTFGFTGSYVGQLLKKHAPDA